MSDTNAGTETSAARLTDALRAFLRTPEDEETVGRWYELLATTCPLWTLQRHAYLTSQGADKAHLEVIGASIPTFAPTTPWDLMNFWSDDAEVDALLSRGFDNDGDVIVFNDPETGVPRPIRSAVDLPDPDLLHRFDTLQRLARIISIGAEPANDELLEMDQHRAWHVYSKLRQLVINRDLAIGGDRETAQRELDGVLSALGISGRRGKPGIPNAEEFIHTVAAEAKCWLLAEHAVRNEEVSAEAAGLLHRLGCQPEDSTALMHLALPFLHRRELLFVRSRKITSQQTHSRLRERPLELTAVFLIHNRLHTFPYKLATVADYAFGDQFVSTTPEESLRHNPLVNSATTSQ